MHARFSRSLLGALLGSCLAVSCHRAPPAPLPPDRFAIRTPSTAPAARINGAQVFGVRPGSPFLFQIAATGERPMQFTATGLPPGLTLDTATGRISGVLATAGDYVIILGARNALGTAERPLRVVAGEEIALTPPMGWNSWNAWGGEVTQEEVLAAARALAASGLRDHGWTYVNVDDGWQGKRGGPFNAIQPNAKFTDMKSLSDEIHGLGLKFGVYSSPWRATFGRHIGSSADTAAGTYDWIDAGRQNEVFQYPMPEPQSGFDRYKWLQPLAERMKKRDRKKFTGTMRTFGRFSFVQQDVAQWSAWGVDYLKYDWVPVDVAHAAEMGGALRRSGRDIVYSVSNNVRLPTARELQRIANSWRTSVDIEDTWASVSDIGFSRDKWAPLNAPGHYNDPDMLVVGDVRWRRPGLTRLSSEEQYTHVSLWCLLSGPLLIGCDLEKLDSFTLGLLTNDEVIEVDQDPLCKQATRVARRGDTEVYGKPLADGSWAIGLFNRGEQESVVRTNWSEVGIGAKQRVRDLWLQKDLGVFDQRFEATVPRHGVVLIRVMAGP